MSDAAHDRPNEKNGRAGDVEALIREIQRYLGFLHAIRTSNPPQKGRGRGRSGT